MKENLESVPLEGRREQEWTERSKCDGFVIAPVPNFSTNSRMRMALQTIPRSEAKMFRWSDLCSHIDLFMVCLTLIKVAFFSRDNCWKSWKMPADRLPAVGSTGPQERRDWGDISECLLSIIMVQKSYTGFHGQMCFPVVLQLSTFSTLGLFFSLSPHYSVFLLLPDFSSSHFLTKY